MMNAHPWRRTRRAGFTLVEMLIVLTIAALVLALATPKFTAFVRYITARSATSQVVADLSLARTQAVREGQTVSLRITGPTQYQLTLDNPAGNAVRVIKTVNVNGSARAVGLQPANARVAFDSRGMLRAADAAGRALIITRPGRADTVTVSVVGRVYRGSINRGG